VPTIGDAQPTVRWCPANKRAKATKESISFLVQTELPINSERRRATLTKGPRGWAGLNDNIIKREVEATGFKLVAEDNFLRHPEDKRDTPSSRAPMPVDEFILKFEKPR